MSAVGDFVVQCNRLGLKIQCDRHQNTVTLRGERHHVDAMTRELEKNVDALLELDWKWMSAMPPRHLAELH